MGLPFLTWSTRSCQSIHSFQATVLGMQATMKPHWAAGVIETILEGTLGCSGIDLSQFPNRATPISIAPWRLGGSLAVGNCALRPVFACEGATLTWLLRGGKTWQLKKVDP